MQLSAANQMRAFSTDRYDMKINLRRRTLRRMFIVCIMFLSASSDAQTPVTPQRLQDIVRFNAPMIIGEVRLVTDPFYRNPYHWRITDHAMPVDFDGDVNAANNDANADRGDLMPVNHTATVYYSVTETGSGDTDGFFYIGYYWYHPRDGGSNIDGFHLGGHPNDLEGILLIVQKSALDPYGQPILALTQAHGALIPFFVPGQVDAGHLLTMTDGVAAWGGQVEFWPDNAFNRARPIVAVRAGTHGSYMAQDCSPTTNSFFYDGYGADVASVASGQGFVSCIHGADGGAIIYRPATADYYADQVPDDQYSGTANYALVDLAQSPMWQLRGVQGSIFYGTSLPLGFTDLAGLDNFNAPAGTSDFANSPWQWLGGPGDAGGPPGNNGYWYSFAMDGTSTVHVEPGQWSRLGGYGEIVVNPSEAAWEEFQNYSGPQGDARASFLNKPVRFNAYRGIADGVVPLNVSIDGPGILDQNSTGVYAAVVNAGTPPYTYQWSGLVSGSDASTQVTMNAPGDLFLDVWDANGQHVALSTYVNMSCSGGFVC